MRDRADLTVRHQAEQSYPAQHVAPGGGQQRIQPLRILRQLGRYPGAPARSRQGAHPRMQCRARHRPWTAGITGPAGQSRRGQREAGPDPRQPIFLAERARHHQPVTRQGWGEAAPFQIPECLIHHQHAALAGNPRGLGEQPVGRVSPAIGIVRIAEHDHVAGPRKIGNGGNRMARQRPGGLRVHCSGDRVRHHGGTLDRTGSLSRPRRYRDRCHAAANEGLLQSRWVWLNLCGAIPPGTPFWGDGWQRR